MTKSRPGGYEGRKEYIMRYNNKFFHTREEAKAFQKEHGGAIYSYTPHSKTRADFRVEMAIAYDARMEVVNTSQTPWCVAWNESD